MTVGQPSFLNNKGKDCSLVADTAVYALASSESIEDPALQISHIK